MFVILLVVILNQLALIVVVCWMQKNSFVRDKDIPEGLEKAELQLKNVTIMQNNDITQLAENQYSIKQYRKH